MNSVSLQSRKKALEQLWQQGLSGQPLLAEQSRLLDLFISERFHRLGRGAEGQVAVLALGGYGRQELFPYSDLDLMILHQLSDETEIKRVADAILYPLWDAGFEVGHGVRTLPEALEHAGHDFFFQVAMLDARLIVGSSEMFAVLMTRYRERFIEGGREEFVRSMKASREARRQRYGSHSYLLEPHVKEGKGGLRDIQAMSWTAKVVFGLDGLTAIVEAGIFLEEERQSFAASWNELIKIRNRLHYISGRKNDQLHFERQELLAQFFGYKDDAGMLGVEKFMRVVHGHLQTIAVMTDLFFDLVDEILGLAVKGEKSSGERAIEKGIEIRHNRLHLTVSAQELSARPHLLMRLFLASAKTGVPIHHRSRKVVSASLSLVDEKQRRSLRMAKPFMEILLHPADPLPTLEVMLETGLLPAYIPEFDQISSLAQHDLYHIYTVDRHLLQTVAELRALIEADNSVFLTISSPHILFLAALLHDIGKGAGGDHSQIGAERVAAVGGRLGLEPSECACLSFLLRYHLFLPENALRRDLNDEVFIHRCAETIGDSDRLASLYLLAIADSKATGPSAWSEWKGALLHELFLKITPYLESGVIHGTLPEAVARQVEQGVDWLRQQSLDLLAGDSEALAILPLLPADYLLAFTPQAVVEHIRSYRNHYQALQRQALIFPRELRQNWSLLIMAADRPGLLAKICGVLTLHNLTVLSAQIFTWEKTERATGKSDEGLPQGATGPMAVDVLEVRSCDGLSFREKDWRAINMDLDRALNYRLGLEHRIHRKLASIYERKRQSGIMLGQQQARVTVDNGISATYTVIEVYSDDRAGQLYHIAQTLAAFGINIHRAFIATEVQQLIDNFYVLDSDGQKISDESFIAEIRDGVLYSLGRDA